MDRAQFSYNTFFQSKFVSLLDKFVGKMCVRPIFPFFIDICFSRAQVLLNYDFLGQSLKTPMLLKDQNTPHAESMKKILEAL